MKYNITENDITAKNLLSIKEKSLKNVTHVVNNDLKAYFYENDKCIFKCYFSPESEALALKLMERESLRYIRYESFNESPLIDSNDIYEYVSEKSPKVQQYIDEFNNKFNTEVSFEIKQDDKFNIHFVHLYCEGYDGWLFKICIVIPLEFHKNSSDSTYIKNEYWEDELKSDLELLEKFLKKEKKIEDNKKITKFHVICEKIYMIFMFFWNFFTSLIRPYIWSIIICYGFGIVLKYSNEHTYSTYLTTALLFLIVWILTVTVPMIIYLKKCKMKDTKFFICAIAIMIILGLYTCYCENWNMLEYALR